MANIFKRTTVKQKIAEQTIKDFDKKLAIVQQWYNAYQDGTLQNKTEGQCEQAFNDDIFKKVLGYTEYPSNPHTIIPQLSPDKGGQRADAGLGWFDGKKQRIFAVVEIKDVNKPLERSQQREGNLTPIQQAFKYKPLFKDCRFVIATNFYEIRLFQDNQLDYEQFTLKSLCDPSNDYFEFKKFILLLCAENFVSGRGKSKTEELLSEIRIEQEKISKDFYIEYSHVRLELMRDIWKNNKTKRDIHFVTDKAQKLLDRIVFVSFCEDSGLLPDNTLHKVFMLSDSSNNFSSVWDTLKGFFKAVDSGSEKLGIPEGYNGGLFHEDHELDSLTISDGALKALSSFGRYDFENELTVNILGHVFEQSISDLEEIKQKVDPDEASIKSKRKKDGIFYTPEYIVDYIVQNSLGKYLRENQERIFEKYELKKAKTEKGYRERENKALLEYQDFLHTVKVVDPACGSGAFLVKVFDYLLEENRRVGELVGGLFSQDQVYKDILRNNIYGVDLNEESVRITQLSLWLKTAQKGKKLTYLDKNIRVGNSLIEDSKVAGSKAFNWKEEFKEVFDKGGFDVVVGNPPYGVSFSEEEKRYLSSFDVLVPDYEVYYYFISKGLDILNNKGYLSYIFPNTFLSVNFGIKYRKKILNNYSVHSLIDLSNDPTFKDASVRTCIVLLSNQTNNKNTNLYKFNDTTFSADLMNMVLKNNLSEQIANWHSLFFETDKTKRIKDKIKNLANTIDTYFEVSQGLIPYDKYRGHSEETIRNRVWHSDVKLDSTFKKELKGSDINRYSLNWNGKTWISYGSWLAAPREPKFFTKPRLLIREITSKYLYTAYTEEEYYNTPSIINVISKEGHEDKLKVVLAILNSMLIGWYHNNNSPKANKGLFPKILVNDVRNIPLPNLNGDHFQVLSSLSDKMIELNMKLIYQDNKFFDILSSKIGSIKVTKKLSKWFLLSWEDFSAILTQHKFKGDLDLVYDLFFTYKNTILETRSNIIDINENIENIVFTIFEIDETEKSQIVADFAKERRKT